MGVGVGGDKTLKTETLGEGGDGANRHRTDEGENVNLNVDKRRLRINRDALYLHENNYF